jgi:hypothetical protein
MDLSLRSTTAVTPSTSSSRQLKLSLRSPTINGRLRRDGPPTRERPSPLRGSVNGRAHGARPGRISRYRSSTASTWPTDKARKRTTRAARATTGSALFRRERGKRGRPGESRPLRAKRAVTKGRLRREGPPTRERPSPLCGSVNGRGSLRSRGMDRSLRSTTAMTRSTVGSWELDLSPRRRSNERQRAIRSGARRVPALPERERGRSRPAAIPERQRGRCKRGRRRAQREIHPG